MYMGVGGSTFNGAVAPRTMFFIDGENIGVRFEKMVADGRSSRGEVKFSKNQYLWTPNFVRLWGGNIIRVNYYTSVVGTDESLAQLQDDIANLSWRGNSQDGQVVPRVFKKAKTGEKSKSVDINICIDVLRHTFANDLDAVILLSGDGDYLPLIREVMRQGKQVWVAAFSSGLNTAIRRTVDHFKLLDPIVFT